MLLEMKCHQLEEENDGKSELTFRNVIRKQFAEGNWTYILHFLNFISGLGLITIGIVSTIPALSGSLSTELNPLHYITCGYIIMFGIVVIAILVEFPPCWERWTWRWVPFLLTFRGRGFFLIFAGGLATGLNWVGIVIGAIVAFVGVINIGMACCFKNSLKKKHRFSEGPPEDVFNNRVEQV